MSDTVGEDLLGLVQRWMAEMEIHSPFPGQAIKDRGGIVLETLASGSTKANPRPISEADVEAMLDKIFA